MHKMLTFCFMLCLLTTMLLSGCAPNVAITPDIVLVQSKDFSVTGKIDYDGNVEYLPRTVSSDARAFTLLTLRYRYDISYGRDSVHQALHLYNPLTLVGFPIGEDTVVVTAKLEILKGSSQIKTYSSVCMLNKYRSLFWEGETMSELRKRGLLAVRDNIESQMFVEKDQLIKAAKQN